MAYAFVSQVGYQVGTSDTTVVLAQTLVVGQRAIVKVGCVPATTTVTGVTDDGGNTYTKIADITGGGVRLTLWEATVTTAANTITGAYSATATSRSIVASLYTGLTGPAQGFAQFYSTNPGTATDAVTVGRVTPAEQPGMLYSYYYSTYTLAATAGTGFTSHAVLGTGYAAGAHEYTEDEAISSVSPVSATWTCSGTTGQLVMLGAYFGLGSAPAVTPPNGWKNYLQALGYFGLVAAILSTIYGATADAGQTDDPLVDAVAYSAGTTYAYGNLVTSGGSYYFSEANGNFGNAVTNTTFWRPISNVYYFSNAGSDSSSADGTNIAYAKANPFATLVKAYSFLKSGGAAPANSLLLFNRGDTFTGSLLSYTACVCGAYGTRTNARPIIYYDNSSATNKDEVFLLRPAASNVAMRNMYLNGRNARTYTFTAGAGTFVAGDLVSRASDGLMPGVVIGTVGGPGPTIAMIHTNTYDAFANGDVFQTAGGAKTGTVTYSSGTTGGALVRGTSIKLANIEMTNCLSNGVTIGFNGTANSADHAYVENCIIHNCCTYSVGSKGAGIEGGWGTGIKLLHNTSYDNGLSQTYSHNIYMDDLDNFEIAYNDLYYTQALGNHGIVVHGVTSYANIHHNYIHECANGIGADGGYPTAESFDNYTIANNLIENCGTLPGQTQGLGITVASLTNSVIADNLLVNNAYTGFDINNANGAEDPNTSNVSFYQNTVVGNYGWSIGGNSTAGISGLRIANNIFVSTASGSSAFTKNAATADASLTINNNLIYTPNAASPITWDGTTYSVAGLLSAKSKGANSVITDPKFTNAGAGNYTLQGTSPALGAGATGLGIATDFNGNAFTIPPNMGAFA